jgi:hypothetical protein
MSKNKLNKHITSAIASPLKYGPHLPAKKPLLVWALQLLEYDCPT